MTLPLEGLKVLDLTRYLPGAYCTGWLLSFHFPWRRSSLMGVVSS